MYCPRYDSVVAYHLVLRHAAGLRELAPRRWPCRRSPQATICRAANKNGKDQKTEQKKNKEEQNPEESWDPTLVAGDALMMIATELASERIPFHDQGFMCLTVCGAWTSIAYLRGDYQPRNLDLSPFADWFMLAPLLASMQAALYTWVIFAPAVVGLLSYMAAHGLVDPALVIETEDSTPAVIEVMWGSALTLASWRGIYAGLYL